MLKKILTLNLLIAMILISSIRSEGQISETGSILNSDVTHIEKLVKPLYKDSKAILAKVEDMLEDLRARLGFTGKALKTYTEGYKLWKGFI